MSITKVQVSLIAVLVVAGMAVPVWQQTRLGRARSENAQWRARESVLTPTQLGSYRQQQALQLKAANVVWAKMGISASK